VQLAGFICISCIVISCLTSVTVMTHQLLFRYRLVTSGPTGFENDGHNETIGYCVNRHMSLMDGTSVTQLFEQKKDTDLSTAHGWVQLAGFICISGIIARGWVQLAGFICISCIVAWRPHADRRGGAHWEEAEGPRLRHLRGRRCEMVKMGSIAVWLPAAASQRKALRGRARRGRGVSDHETNTTPGPVEGAGDSEAVCEDISVHRSAGGAA
jgi:hypothetical protein